MRPSTPSQKTVPSGFADREHLAIRSTWRRGPGCSGSKRWRAEDGGSAQGSHYLAGIYSDDLEKVCVWGDSNRLAIARLDLGSLVGGVRADCLSKRWRALNELGPIECGPAMVDSVEPMVSSLVSGDARVFERQHA